jgi:hypothetical protein
MFAGALAIPVIAHTTSHQNAKPTGVQAEAIRDHVDEAEDLVDSLLRWRHVTSWSDKGKLHAPPPEGPANTLISIEQVHVQKLTALLGALAAQLPSVPSDEPRLRGDLRAHLDKAQQIARELQPPHATEAADAAHAAGGLVTIDRTTLERLNVELEAMEELLPRTTK